MKKLKRFKTMKTKWLEKEKKQKTVQPTDGDETESLKTSYRSDEDDIIEEELEEDTKTLTLNNTRIMKPPSIKSARSSQKQENDYIDERDEHSVLSLNSIP